jgi:hypothetical protein
LNKNELADFVPTVKAAWIAQRVVAVVDQHPNFFVYFHNNHKSSRYYFTEYNKYILIKFFLSSQYNSIHVNMASNSVQEG